MATNWPQIPAFDSPDEIDGPLPREWRVEQIEALYDQLPIGKRFDQRSSSSQGTVPVIDQSADSIIGWHDEQPGVIAASDSPVVTFANHTCEMRLMRRPFSVIQNVFPLVGKKGICDSRFLYYGTKGRMRLEEYKGHYPDFRRKWILVPPLAEQHAIAHILGTLDDKIELNRRMNETLEAMARALFKSWFVDFDPVRAKAEGRDPGLPKPLADLFPARLVGSEIGEIPEGWEVRSVDEFALLNPETWSRDTRPDVISYVDLSNTKWGRIETVTSYAQQDAPSRAQRVLRSSDTIVGTVRPGNGSYAFIAEDGLTGSTGFAVLRPRKTEYAEFVYLAATAQENIEALSHLADGGAYPAVRPEVVAATRVTRASDEVLRGFSRAVGPLIAKIAVNDRESRTLAAVRDLLLPKLIAGELRLDRARLLTQAVE